MIAFKYHNPFWVYFVPELEESGSMTDGRFSIHGNDVELIYAEVGHYSGKAGWHCRSLSWSVDRDCKLPLHIVCQIRKEAAEQPFERFVFQMKEGHRPFAV